MPIKGLTDRALAFPEIGQIRKGTPKQKIQKDGREIEIYGKDLEYFRVDFDPRETEAIAIFEREYPGSKPSELNIVLPFNDIDGVWGAWYEAYTAGWMIARSDGEIFIYLVDTKTGETKVRNGLDVKTRQVVPYTEGQIVGHDYQNKPVYCKPTGRLKVVFPELQRLAYLTMLTGSVHDIINISSQLRAIQGLCHQMGKGLGGVPLVLRRRPKEISTPEVVSGKRTGKRIRRTKWLISVEADSDFVKRALIETKRLALPGNGIILHEPPVLELPEHIIDIDIDDDIEEEIIEETVASPAPSNGRPHEPARVKARIVELIESFEDLKTDVHENQRKVLASVLDTTFGGEKTMRYELCQWLVGDASTKKMTAAKVRALLTWMGVEKFDDVPPEYAIAEAISCHTAALEAGGQKKLL